MSEPLRLNLGAGEQPLPGWENLDAKTGQEVYPLPYPDGSAEAVRASHVLEHFGHGETEDVLREWVRVLKPGGSLQIAVPDFERIIEWYQEGRNDLPLMGYLMGGQTDPLDYHKVVFTEGTLEALMTRCGLVGLRPWQSELPDCASLAVSLNRMGWKGHVPEGAAPPASARETAVREAIAVHPETITLTAEEKERDLRLDLSLVRAVLSAPRLGFLDTADCIVRLAQLGISFERRGGVFWDQAMTHLLERHLEDGTRYLLTLDYDSVFRTQDVLRLLQLMELRPEVDALCSVQSRRGKEGLLFCLDFDRGAEEWSCEAREITVPATAVCADAMRVASGHFGLSVLRVDALRRVPRPWFAAVPDAEGRWGEGRMDADIAFWHRWKQAGNSIWLANRVVIGHAQMMVTWPGPGLYEPVHQYPQDWNDHGKPPGTWA